MGFSRLVTMRVNIDLLYIETINCWLVTSCFFYNMYNEGGGGGQTGSNGSPCKSSEK